jgi:hypothetical protein
LIVRLSGLHCQDNESVIRWLQENAISVLNVADPKESSEPGIQAEAWQWIEDLLTRLS